MLSTLSCSNRKKGHRLRALPRRKLVSSRVRRATSKDTKNKDAS